MQPLREQPTVDRHLVLMQGSNLSQPLANVRRDVCALWHALNRINDLRGGCRRRVNMLLNVPEHLVTIIEAANRIVRRRGDAIRHTCNVVCDNHLGAKRGRRLVESTILTKELRGL